MLLHHASHQDPQVVGLVRLLQAVQIEVWHVHFSGRMGLLDIGKVKASKLPSLFDFVQSGRIAAGLLVVAMIPPGKAPTTVDYDLPCGVWVVRTACRGAAAGEPLWERCE